MKVIFENNSALGAGYGLFKITKNTNGLSSPYSFVLTCSSNNKSLSLDGWQDASKALKADSFEDGIDAVTIFVGPEIVDHLDAMELYRFSLISYCKSDQDNILENATLELNSIIYSPLHGTGVIAKKASKVTTPEPKPENLLTANDTTLSDTALTVENAQNTLDKPIDSKNSQAIKIIIAILLLCCLIFIFWMYGKDIIKYISNEPTTSQELVNETTKTQELSDKNKEQAKLEQDKLEQDKLEQDKLVQDKLEQDKAEQDKAEQDKLAQDKLAQDSISNQKAKVEKKLSPRQQVHNFLKTDSSTKDTVALAQKLEKEDNGLDYSFIMWEVAAEKGDAQSMMMVAKFYNPADSSPHGSIIKDPSMALSWYKKAEQTGTIEATAKIEELKKWAEKESAKGSSQAAEYLKNLQ